MGLEYDGSSSSSSVRHKNPYKKNIIVTDYVDVVAYIYLLFTNFFVCIIS